MRTGHSIEAATKCGLGDTRGREAAVWEGICGAGGRGVAGRLHAQARLYRADVVERGRGLLSRARLRVGNQLGRLSRPKS